jgi:TPP-dependent pyruvate/acetoin dehydrogenase alpha subunit
VNPAKSEVVTTPAYDAKTAVSVFRLMVMGRQFEEQLGAIFARGDLAGWFHSCIGHEATGAALGAILRDTDHLVPYHRSRAALFAKGMTPREVALEMMGRVESPSKGRGGDGHIIHPERRIYGMSGSLGASPAIASGVAYAAQLRGTDEIVVNGFGEGTANRGVVWEAVNFAAIWNLPLVFICENNLYAEFTPIRDVNRVEHVSDRAIGYGVPRAIVDGNDPESVAHVLTEAVARARSGSGPTVIEAKTYRLRGHYEGDPQGYRDKEEITEWTGRDPVAGFRTRLLEDGRATENQLAALEVQVTAGIAADMQYALAQRLPNSDELLRDVYVDEEVAS